MNRISIFFAAFAVLVANNLIHAQAPGGVATGLTAWYYAEAGTTPTVGALTTWANQATNPNLTNLTPVLLTGGTAPAIVNNDPTPFNFHNFLQHNNSAMFLANSVTYTDVAEYSNRYQCTCRKLYRYYYTRRQLCLYTECNHGKRNYRSYSYAYSY